MYTIPPQKLKSFVDNQAAMAHRSPITERARFKMDELLIFLNEMKAIAANNNIPQKLDSFYLDMSVVFIRQKGKEILPHFHAVEGEDDYSAVIPLIVPSIYRSSNGFSEFAYLRDEEGNIPYFTPGGESTGLIPPPPGIDEDFS